MTPDLAIPQAVVVADRSGPAVVARSDGVPFTWEEALLTIAARFGSRPSGVTCPAAIFALPLVAGRVAVVQVADLPGGGADPPLGFRFLLLSRRLYEALGDPFAIADRFPPDWSARGHLPTLDWPPRPLPGRTVGQLQTALQTGDTALLLGGTQALLDGGRLMLQSDVPQTDTLRDIWQLLPDRSRIDLWPASFAFCNELGFHAVTLPRPPVPWPAGYLTVDQARDYPEGRYELCLQIAIEAGNQAEVNRLLARHSSRDTLRLGIYLVAAAVMVALTLKVIG